MCFFHFQIRNVETNQCLDNMARKENEKVGIFNCHGMGGNQVIIVFFNYLNVLNYLEHYFSSEQLFDSFSSYL